MNWSDLDGWLSPDEADALRALTIGATVLELGSYKGRSTALIASVAKRVVSVDHHKGDENTGRADTLAAFLANLEACGVRPKVVAVVAPLDDALPVLAPGTFDAAFVDDAHDAASVERSTRHALRLVKPGGVLAWHDWDHAGVKDGVRACGLSPIACRGTLAWGHTPAV